jgi:hypothetical protein
MSSDILELNRALREGRSTEQREAEQRRTERLGQAVGSLFSPVGGADVLGSLPVPVYAGSEGIPMTAPRKTQVDALAVPNFALNELRTPANLVGAGLLKKGSQAMDAMTGPLSGRGMALSSADNVIPGFYGTTPGLATAAYLPKNTAATLRDLMNPASRALYRETGATRRSQELARNQLKEAERPRKPDERGPNPMHVGIANTGQYLSRIRAQGGREGKVADVLLNMEELSDFVPASSYKVGDYKRQIKDKDITATKTGTGRRVNVSDKDLEIFEEHFGRVWKEPDATGAQVPFAKGKDTKLVIKAPGAGGASVTGKHYNDVMYNAPYVAPLKKLFRDRTEVPYEELEREMRKLSEKSIEKASKLADKAKAKGATAEDKNAALAAQRAIFRVADATSKENGLWITGSRAGSAITEGGINYLVKVKPNGTMTGVMSDEHNLYENLASKIQRGTGGVVPALDMMKKIIPHRLVAVTPPMTQNVRNLDVMKSKARGVAGISQAKNPNVGVGTDSGKTAKGMLQELAALEPSKEALRAEQMRSAGGGLLLGNLAVEEEERGR